MRIAVSATVSFEVEKSNLMGFANGLLGSSVEISDEKFKDYLQQSVTNALNIQFHEDGVTEKPQINVELSVMDQKQG